MTARPLPGSSSPSGSRRQQGMTLIGLLLWAMGIGAVAYVLIQALPTVNEYYTIQRAINKIAGESPPTVAQARDAFERIKSVEYSISSISGKDLDVSKVNDKVVIAFAYDKEIPLAGPVFLVIKYEGRSK